MLYPQLELQCEILRLVLFAIGTDLCRVHCRFAVMPVSVYQYGCDKKLGLTRRAFGVIHGHNRTVSLARRLVNEGW